MLCCFCSFGLISFSFPYREMRNFPKTPQTTKQGSTRCKIFTQIYIHKYTSRNKVYSLWKICSWVSFPSLPKRTAQKKSCWQSQSTGCCYENSPKFRPWQTEVSVCVWERDWKWAGLYIPTKYRRFAHHRYLNLAKTTDTKPNHLTLGPLPLYW